jgi:plasmid rolling circle replication initiator protein Rep
LKEGSYGRCFPLFFDFMNKKSVILTTEANRNDFALSTALIRPRFSASSRLESQPRAYFNNKQYLRVGGQPDNRPKPKKRKRLLSERLTDYYQTRERLSRLYSELGNEKKSAKIHKCSSFFNLLTCGDHIVRRTANFRCNNRLCPDCANRRGNRLFSKYEPIINSYLAENPDFSVLHLVLTQAQKSSETIRQARQRLVEAIKRLVDRKFWKDSFAGSLNSYEFTVSKKTFSDGAIHYHAHLLVFCKLSNSQRSKKWLSDFRDVWSSVSKGENKNLKIRPVMNLQTGLREVLKYIVKPSDIKQFSTNHLSQIEELRKHKMVSTTGEFHKFVKSYREPVREPELELEMAQELRVGDACPVCQKPLHERQMPVKELIIYARNIEQVKGRNAVRC